MILLSEPRSSKWFISFLFFFLTNTVLLDLITSIHLQFVDEYCQKLMSRLQDSGRENAFGYGGWLRMNCIIRSGYTTSGTPPFQLGKGLTSHLL